jgi:16S rRNA (guanine1207-N2)-methyltransferase
MKNYHYFSENEENLKSEPSTYVFKYKDHEFTFKTDNGVFSKKFIDFGSYTMLNYFKPNQLEGDILDVGCGYGPIGIILSVLHNKKVTMVDINERALGLAKENIRINGVQNVNVFKSNVYENVPETMKFASIVTNPPIRAGKKVIYDIFDGAYQRLLPNGELWVVIQKKQGAPSTKTHLESVFGNCEVVGKESGYFILKSVR